MSSLLLLPEFRCTRPDLYRGTASEKDVTVRQGHYIRAADEDEARREMRQRYPNDSEFTIQRWKEPLI
jgi:hypothetical protein